MIKDMIKLGLCTGGFPDPKVMLSISIVGKCRKQCISSDSIQLIKGPL